MEKTEKQLDHLKEGLQKLNGQARILECHIILYYTILYYSYSIV